MASDKERNQIMLIVVVGILSISCGLLSIAYWFRLIG